MLYFHKRLFVDPMRRPCLICQSKCRIPFKVSDRCKVYPKLSTSEISNE